MTVPPVSTWDRLYSQVGYPGTNDPETACAVIITALTAPHQDRLIATEDHYVNIRLHSHLSAVPVPRFGEVMRRQTTVLPPETMTFITIEVLQLVNPHIRSRICRQLVPTTPNEVELRSDSDSRR